MPEIDEIQPAVPPCLRKTISLAKKSSNWRRKTNSSSLWTQSKTAKATTDNTLIINLREDNI